MVSSTLVNVADDAELRLVRLLAEAAPSGKLSSSFVEDCESRIVNADASGLIKTIVNDQGAVAALFYLDSIDAAVSAFSLLAALLDRVSADSPEEEAGLAKSLADAVVNSKGDEMKETGEQAKRRIALLSAFYNLRSNGSEKCTLVSHMVQLAGEYEPGMLSASHSLGQLFVEDSSTSSPVFLALLDAWGVPQGDRRQLFKTVAEFIPDSASRKQRFTLLLVDTYKEESDVNVEGMDAARKAAVGAIRDPITLFMEQRDMLTMPAVQALAKNQDTKQLYGLLTVFQEGKLEDYYAFLKENGGEIVLTRWDLSGEECVRHMRILSLCTLASEHEEIPYSTVTETLQLPSDADVESWVISAVSSGLLSAKMDQLEQKVMVERSVVRQFDMSQWKAVQTRLHTWRDNVRSILEALEKSQQANVGSQQPV